MRSAVAVVDGGMQWLDRAQRLMALAQNGLTFATSPFDVQRYGEIREIAATIMAEGGSGDAAQIVELFSRESGYATPKIDARGAVFRDGRILLVRERADGGWTLPGGWADVLDSPRSAVEREIREESGFETRATKLLAVFDKKQHPHPVEPFHAWKMFIRCEIVGGSAQTSIETDGVEFFARDAIPPLSLGRTAPTQLAILFAHLDDPDRPADFD